MKKLKTLNIKIFDIFRISNFEFRISRFAGGFGLVEFLIATALFGIIAAFILLAYGRVSDQLSITTLAYELALSFRQAQSYGVSVHEFRDRGTGTFDVGYGLHFDKNNLNKDNLNTYVLFADAGGSSGAAIFNGSFGGAYNETGCLVSTECINVFRLEKGNKIYKFCGVLSDDKGRDVVDAEKHEECSLVSPPGIGSTPPPPLNSPPNISALDVTFLRPNPDAIIRTNLSASGEQYKAARVYIVSPTGIKRVIEVMNTGQISIK